MALRLEDVSLQVSKMSIRFSWDHQHLIKETTAELNMLWEKLLRVWLERNVSFREKDQFGVLIHNCIDFISKTKFSLLGVITANGTYMSIIKQNEYLLAQYLDILPVLFILDQYNLSGTLTFDLT